MRVQLRWDMDSLRTTASPHILERILQLVSHRIICWANIDLDRVHLFGASVTLGGVAVWGMWFIGNRAINLGDGSQPYQISYAASFIALSFFVPIIVFLISFCILGSVETLSLWTIIRTIVAAVLTAVGVASMHYIGQAGIINYDCIYHVSYAIGSAFLVAGSFTVGLLMFVMFRASWHSDWWKRGLCAMLVASAIGSSNWLASVGTEYRFRKANRNAAINYKNSTIVIFVIVVSFATTYAEISNFP